MLVDNILYKSFAFATYNLLLRITASSNVHKKINSFLTGGKISLLATFVFDILQRWRHGTKLQASSLDFVSKFCWCFLHIVKHQDFSEFDLQRTDIFHCHNFVFCLLFMTDFFCFLHFYNCCVFLFPLNFTLKRCTQLAVSLECIMYFQTFFLFPNK